MGVNQAGPLSFNVASIGFRALIYRVDNEIEELLIFFFFAFRALLQCF